MPQSANATTTLRSVAVFLNAIIRLPLSFVSPKRLSRTETFTGGRTVAQADAGGAGRAAKGDTFVRISRRSPATHGGLPDRHLQSVARPPPGAPFHPVGCPVSLF